MSGGAKKPKTPASETALKQIETDRYNLAQGYNEQYLGRYASEADHDVSAKVMGMSNADVMANSMNPYLTDGTKRSIHSAADTLAGGVASARTDAMTQTEGNRMQRNSAVLDAANGQLDAGSKGLGSLANTASNAAIHKMQRDMEHRNALVAGGMAIAGGAYLGHRGKQKKIGDFDDDQIDSISTMSSAPSAHKLYNTNPTGLA